MAEDNPLNLHPQTIAFLDDIIANPKKKQTDAYIETHHLEPKTPKERVIAGNTASRLINKPASKLYLKKHRDMAKRTKIELLQHARGKKDNLGYARLANDISEQILDRTDGKPIQKQQTESTNLNLNIEASEELSKDFVEFLKQQTKQG